MEQLEITTNKRLLIVEFPEMPEVYKYHKEFIFFKFKKENEYNDGAIRVGFEKIKEICKGSDLTEDIAKGLVPNDLGFLFDGDSKEYYAYPDYKNIDHPFEDKSFDTAIESFISAIESKNYHWGENPVKFPIYSTITYGTMPGSYSEFMKDVRSWNESESRTFKPSQCIIFEIL